MNHSGLNHRDTEAHRGNEITDAIIGAGTEAHQVLELGLLESVYRECLVGPFATS